MGIAAAARSGVFTYDDFCALVHDDQKADLIDGVIYMASPENTEAHDLFGWLYTIMRLYVRKRETRQNLWFPRRLPAGRQKLTGT